MSVKSRHSIRGFLRSSHSNSLDAQSQQLQDISPISHSTVGEDFGLGEDFWCIIIYFKDNFQGALRGIKLTGSMVGDVDCWCTVRYSQFCILDGLNALWNDW
jgi:hypothetical protein